MDVTLVVNKAEQTSGLSAYSDNLKNNISARINVKEMDTKRFIPHILISLDKILPFDICAILSRIPIFLPIPKGSIVHLTNQSLVLPLFFSDCRSLVTIHDVIEFESRKQNISLGKNPSFFYRSILSLNKVALRRADMISADSEYTKKRVMDILNYPAEKIKVIPLGVDKSVFYPKSVERDSFAILYVGSEMPRKNLSVLFRAFAKLKKKIHEARLIKVGVPQWPGARESLLKLGSELGISEAVIFKDYVRNLPMEYCKATLFVHPSIYEGFGFPIIEAMACGCPVISSDKTSLPEVGGDAALYFDGYNVDDLAKKMQEVLESKRLQQCMRVKGFAQARRFSWKRCAKKTISLYSALNSIKNKQ